jgi:hypothetical protein
MTLITCHFLSLHSSVSKASFISALRTLPVSQRPLWLGQTHHWIHEPHLSTKALLGEGAHLIKWDYIFLGSKELPPTVESQIASRWSITGYSPEGTPSAREKTRMLLGKSHPKLAAGWTSDDHDGLKTSVAPSGVVFSLGATSRPMGAVASDQGITLKEFTLHWGIQNTGPVVMLNLLSFLPGQRSVYFEGYAGGFTEILEPLFGGSPIQFGLETSEWSSRAEEAGQESGWEDFALVWYPSLWHFSSMINSPEYASLDRRFKPSVRDNPLLCCTAIDFDSHSD